MLKISRILMLAALAGSAALAAGGCGQKGPLYLPDPNVTPQAPPAPATTDTLPGTAEELLIPSDTLTEPVVNSQ